MPKAYRFPPGLLFRDLKAGEYKVLNGRRTVSGQSAYVAGALLPSGECLIIVTDKKSETDLEDYKIRWGIETLIPMSADRKG